MKLSPSRSYLLLTILALLVGTRPATAQEAQEPKTPQQRFALGFIASLAGQYAHLGNLMLRGAELATHDCNAQLDKLNAQLALQVEDDRLVDNKTTLTIVKKFVTVDKPIAILAWAFSTAEAIKLGLGNHKIPVLFFWDANETIPTLGDNFYGTGPAIPIAARVIAEDLRATNATTLGSFMLVDSWTERMNQALLKQAAEYGIRVTATESVLHDSADYRAPILRLKKQAPSAVAVWSFGSALITIVKQLRQIWPHVTLYGVGTPESDMQLMGASGEGMLIVNGWATGPIADRLAQKSAEARRNTDTKQKAPSPTELAYSVYAYTSASLVCEALKKGLRERNGSITPETVNANLKSVSFDAGVGEVAPGRFNNIKERLLEWRSDSPHGGSFRLVTR